MQYILWLNCWKLQLANNSSDFNLCGNSVTIMIYSCYIPFIIRYERRMEKNRELLNIFKGKTPVESQRITHHFLVFSVHYSLVRLTQFVKFWALFTVTVHLFHWNRARNNDVVPIIPIDKKLKPLNKKTILL